MIASSPAARSETQAVNVSSVVSSKITDMHTSMIKIERQRLGVAFAQGEGGCGFGGVGEAVELGEVEGAVAVCDVAEDAAGADRGELLIITDKPDTRTTIEERTAPLYRGRGCRPSRLRR